MTIVTPAEFKSRRQKLMNYLGPNTIAILQGAQEALRNGDVHYPFRQDSNFYYLTGFMEPDAVAVFSNTAFILFNRPRNPERELWEGRREGQEGAVKNYGADSAFSIETFETHIKKFSKNKIILEPTELNKFLSELRLFKSPDEIKTMRMANQISISAHTKTIQNTKPDLYEYNLQAIFMAETLNHGSFHQAYPSIVASGKNSCTLHYMENNQKILNNQIILMDAGCEFENYASDITRTFPANGKFSQQQKDVYSIVYEAQKAAINHIKPNILWHEPQELVTKILTQGLIDLKLLHGNLEDLITQKAYLPYYMHKYGHWLGLDTHDVGAYRKDEDWRKLKPGMVLTVEPGLYIPQWEIGVRLEDNVLVTDSGHENFTEKLPTEISAIEKLMGS